MLPLQMRGILIFPIFPRSLSGFGDLEGWRLSFSRLLHRLWGFLQAVVIFPSPSEESLLYFLVTSPRSFSLSRRGPPPHQFFSLRFVPPPVRFCTHVFFLGLGSLFFPTPGTHPPHSRASYPLHRYSPTFPCSIRLSFFPSALS